MTTSHQNRQLEIQQAFKELSLSLSKQLTAKSRFKNTTTTITHTSETINNDSNNDNNNDIIISSQLVTSKSTPYTTQHTLKKPKSFGTFNLLEKQQQHPYSPWVDWISNNDSNTDTTLLPKQDILQSTISPPLLPSFIPSSDSSSSSHYSGDSIPSTPTLPFINSKDRKMRRIPSSSSSLGSLTTNSSSRSKHSGYSISSHFTKWDWTIEEDAYGNSNLHDLPPHLRLHQDHDQENRLISTLEPAERDLYGFKKPVQWVKLKRLQQFEHQYQSILLHQKKKWSQLLIENDNQFPSPSSRLRRYVRRGIPHDYRGKAWMHYSGAKAKMEAHVGLFESLVETAMTTEDQNEYAEIIRRDLHRTFPDNIYFACAHTDELGNVIMDPESNEKLVSLKRILYAFSVHSPHIGYCQSLNYLVGFFLLFTESDEEAFWLLVTTVYDYCPPSKYDVTMEGANIDQVLLMMMVYERMPSIWNKLANGKCFWECEQADTMPPITLVTSHWFLTLFINIMPTETVLRIWDSFFIEGYKTLFRVALTMIKMNECQIWALEDPIDVFPLLQNMPRRLIDCHHFMEMVFSSSSIASDITLQEIESKRNLFKDRRKQRQQAKFKQFINSKID
ncbi:rab-GTPase-TBC domain-containing protein [Halteromyces radiatus]|uniref:rab-GTPase-TBC domain-containing protein n=1 Tax=Halteromyces radiatus TaxID=101107 RepID=UPI00221EF639|nr:rab-GTPase-TBC domain-containing protein [Halteromyces radiatus]KAI8086444.1 rab-GTPase-TBC domain-containing protein [Halteromyces radiatus]